MAHLARSFAALPDRNQAPLLLGEMATAPCQFCPVAADAPLALYGAGNLGRLAREFLKAVGHDFDMAIDRNAKELAQSSYWSGVQLVHPDNVTERAKNNYRLAVSLVSSPYVAIEHFLLAQGFSRMLCRFMTWPKASGTFIRCRMAGFLRRSTPSDQNNTAEVLKLWDDDVSRAHHLQCLAWRRLREEWSFG